MKKVLSLVLVIALVLGSFSFAFGMTDIAGEDSEVAVQTLVSLGIINGYKQADGTYKFMPTKEVKRAEMAKILVVALGYEELALATTCGFSDVPEGYWATRYIDFAANLGIIKGYPDGTYRPEDPVKYPEVLAMVLRAIGYKDIALQGSWPTNYVVKALDLGLTEDVTLGSGGADRGGVATVIFNALEVDIATVNADGDVSFTDKDNDAETDNNVKLIDKLGATSASETVDLEDVFGTGALDSEVDLTPYVFQTVTTYTNEDDVIVYVTGGNTTETGEVTTTSTITLDDEDETEVDIAGITSSAILFNGAPSTETDGNELLVGATVKVVYDADDAVIGLVVEQAADPVSIAAEYDAEDPDDIDGITLPTTTDDDDETITDLDNVTVTGDATSLEDIAVDDVVYVYAADDDSVVKIDVVRSTFTGTVKEKKTSTIVVDGEELGFNSGSSFTFIEAALGTEYTFALDADGDIFAKLDGEAEETDYAYGVVIASENGTYDETVSFGTTTKTITEAPQVKILNQDGDQVVVDLYWDIEDSTGCAVVTEAGGDLTIAPLTSGDVYQYTTNDDGEITLIEAATGLAPIDGSVEGIVVANSALLTDDTIIFHTEDADTANWTVLDADSIGDAVTGSAVVDSDTDEISILDIDLADIDSPAYTGTYALVLEVSTVLDADEEPVNKVVAYIDGVEETLYTEDDTLTFTVGDLVDLEITDELISDIVSTLTPDILTTTVQSVVGDNVKLGGNYKELNEDVVVYVYDASDDAYTVGSVSDIEEDAQMKAYQLDSEDSTITHVVIEVE